jgi:hypothetical protein
LRLYTTAAADKEAKTAADAAAAEKRAKAAADKETKAAADKETKAAADTAAAEKVGIRHTSKSASARHITLVC